MTLEVREVCTSVPVGAAPRGLAAPHPWLRTAEPGCGRGGRGPRGQGRILCSPGPRQHGSLGVPHSTVSTPMSISSGCLGPVSGAESEGPPREAPTPQVSALLSAPGSPEGLGGPHGCVPGRLACSGSQGRGQRWLSRGPAPEGARSVHSDPEVPWVASVAHGALCPRGLGGQPQAGVGRLLFGGEDLAGGPAGSCCAHS